MAEGGSRKLVLAAMVFAVSMTFIDQTIVSIAAPQIQEELDLTNTGLQWAINAYLLALAALFAFGGRLGDTLGHPKMVVRGVLLFAVASIMCGLTPKGELAEAWIVTFRVLQGAGGAIMFPAALAIVVQAYPLHERGRALAVFFGIAGALTAVGPILGGVLTELDWRAIFWVNVPVAAIALILTAKAKPTTLNRPAPMDLRGAALIGAGVALSVLGFQQSALWHWDNPATGLCIAAGLILLVAFYFVERRTPSPVIQVSIFRIRAFLVENAVIAIVMVVFLPTFFFASQYAQVALGKSPSQAGLFIMYFFFGLVVASQIGGRILDRRGAKPAVVAGCVIAAVGFAMWAGQVTKLSFGSQVWCLVLAGFGMGLILGPAQTDAVDRASKYSYGEASGITQTLRNYAGSLGIAILGTIQVADLRSHVTTSFIEQGAGPQVAAAQAASISQARGGGSTTSIPHFLRLDFAYATRTVFYVMAGVMVLAALVAIVGLQSGVQEEDDEAAPGQATEPMTAARPEAAG